MRFVLNLIKKVTKIIITVSCIFLIVSIVHTLCEFCSSTNKLGGGVTLSLHFDSILFHHSSYNSDYNILRCTDVVGNKYADLPTFYEIMAEDLPSFGKKTWKIFVLGK